MFHQAISGARTSRDYLIEVVSNRQAEVDIRTADALVARLRRKLVGSGTPVIATVTASATSSRSANGCRTYLQRDATRFHRASMRALIWLTRASWVAQ